MEMKERTYVRLFRGKTGKFLPEKRMNEGENREWEEEMRHFSFQTKV